MSDKYAVILADPPWRFKVWNKDTGQGRSAESHYPTMKTEKIGFLPIYPITADNSVLFLWSVWPLLPDALEVIKAWGFEYKTIAWVWVKAKKSGFGFHFGMGYYTRANSEPCLLATKGNMPVAVHNIQALIYSPVREHSRKPDDQYRKIESLYPGRKYLELFARRERKGWKSVGFDIDGKDIRESLLRSNHDKMGE